MVATVARRLAGRVGTGALGAEVEVARRARPARRVASKGLVAAVADELRRPRGCAPQRMPVLAAVAVLLRRGRRSRWRRSSRRAGRGRALGRWLRRRGRRWRRWLLPRRQRRRRRLRLLARLQLVLGDEALELGDAPLRIDELLAEEVERGDVLVRLVYHRCGCAGHARKRNLLCLHARMQVILGGCTSCYCKPLGKRGKL